MKHTRVLLERKTLESVLSPLAILWSGGKLGSNLDSLSDFGLRLVLLVLTESIMW